MLDAARYDGAGYHVGYVVECVLKTLLQVSGASLQGQDLSALNAWVAALATGDSPHTARYIPDLLPDIAYATLPAGWKETMRYRAPGDLTWQQAQNWLTEAERVYQQTVQQMWIE
ncbi:MAG: hypothetical protein J7463_03915 [Roseiflexus sp.]|nr:hypothetical protein [Roseiflexus sp.]MBO9334089.1 hypothetical protein [Roseiflexus sp.]MBO9340580.1 hypothetical protein [Roseiflexus sp.]MBO9363947.1 hypothetical protein [Roseiflexus sp.]MBO9382295.1 hypothetical protein [Roseiflexus sp.]